MLRKKIKFVDYNDVEHNEEFYFNLSKAEVAEMELTMPGGFIQHMMRLVAMQNGPELFKFFKGLILGSYGIKSPDGRQFVKNQQLRDEFEQCPAYDVLLMELLTGDDTGKAVNAFVEGILPQDLVEEARKQMK